MKLKYLLVACAALFVSFGGQQPDRQTLLRKPIQPSCQQRQLLRRTAQRRVQPEVEDVSSGKPKVDFPLLF